MTRTLTSLAFGLVACAALVAAQVPQEPKPADPPGPTVTYTGCIETGTEPNTYVISHVTPEGPDTSFVLPAPPTGFDWKAHLNHQVEIVAVQPPASASSDKESKSTTAPRTLIVRSAKMVSDRCGL